MPPVISSVVYSETITKTITKKCPYDAILLNVSGRKPILVVSHVDADGTEGVAAFVVDDHTDAHVIATRIYDVLAGGTSFGEATKDGE